MYTLSCLDEAARCNLDKYDIAKYYRYKEFLRGDPDIIPILIGFIWGCLEDYED